MSGPSVPIICALRPAPDPVRACERLESLPYRLFLDSSAPGSGLGRFSFLTADPVAVVRSKGSHTEIVDQATAQVRTWAGDALTAVRALLSPHRAVPTPGAPPFQGGAAGYLAYDWGRTLERVPAPRHDDLGLWDVVLGIYDWVICWDHDRSTACLVSTGMPEEDGERRVAKAAERIAFVNARLDGRLTRAGEPVGARPQARPSGGATASAAPSSLVSGEWWGSSVPLRSSFTRAGYLSAVSRIREYILAGDIFQANLTQRFEAPLAVSSWALYCWLRAHNPAPFAAYVDLGGVAIVSASPERFLCVDSTGRVESRPIKGTRPRGSDPQRDEELGRALAESPKDRAENLMIVDLMRNDLSRVCAPGTVGVPQFCALERHPTVQHLVSTVVGRLDEGADAADLLRAAFPGGSITGAPKIRAMEIIAGLETPSRGVYCGSIGYWSLTGELDMSIAIRTAVATGGRVYFGAGGGIVADSDPTQEYLETLDKARAIIDALVALA